ncbi:unnamed protein product [Lampetra fluviatilis]
MADGTWSFTFPICQPVLCQLPTKRLSLEVEALTKLEFDSVITYSCNKAQVLLGSTERMCQADGTWNGVEPECRVGETRTLEIPVRVVFQLRSAAYLGCSSGWKARGAAR